MSADGFRNVGSGAVSNPGPSPHNRFFFDRRSKGRTGGQGYATELGQFAKGAAMPPSVDAGNSHQVFTTSEQIAFWPGVADAYLARLPVGKLRRSC